MTGTDPTAAGRRIEALLDDLRAGVIPRAYEQVEEVVRLVTELYGAGLERILEVADRAHPALVRALADDDLVGGLLVLHGLHPDDLALRVEAALASVRPLLAHHGGGVELLDVDEPLGAVHLRLTGSCDGCPSSTVTLRNAVEKAIVEAAPEVAIIDVEADEPVLVPGGPGGAEGVPIALGRRHAYDACPSELAEVAAG